MLYLAWDESQTVDDGADGPWEEIRLLRPGLLAIDSEAGRSAVYHALKDLLPPSTPLLVAPLDGPPKLSRLPAGTTTWFRERAG